MPLIYNAHITDFNYPWGQPQTINIKGLDYEIHWHIHVAYLIFAFLRENTYFGYVLYKMKTKQYC